MNKYNGLAIGHVKTGATWRQTLSRGRLPRRSAFFDGPYTGEFDGIMHKTLHYWKNQTKKQENYLSECQRTVRLHSTHYPIRTVLRPLIQLHQSLYLQRTLSIRSWNLAVPNFPRSREVTGIKICLSMCLELGGSSGLPLPQPPPNFQNVLFPAANTCYCTEN